MRYFMFLLLFGAVSCAHHPVESSGPFIKLNPTKPISKKILKDYTAPLTDNVVPAEPAPVIEPVVSAVPILVVPRYVTETPEVLRGPRDPRKLNQPQF